MSTFARIWPVAVFATALTACVEDAPNPGITDASSERDAANNDATSSNNGESDMGLLDSSTVDMAQDAGADMATVRYRLFPGELDEQHVVGTVVDPERVDCPSPKFAVGLALHAVDDTGDQSKRAFTTAIGLECGELTLFSDEISVRDTTSTRLISTTAVSPETGQANCRPRPVTGIRAMSIDVEDFLPREISASCSMVVGEPGDASTVDRRSTVFFKEGTCERVVGLNEGAEEGTCLLHELNCSEGFALVGVEVDVEQDIILGIRATCRAVELAVD